MTTPPGRRRRAVYTTSDGSSWLLLDFPQGLVSPPSIDLHRPMVGTITHYHADSYGLPIPPEAAALLEEDQQSGRRPS